MQQDLAGVLHVLLHRPTVLSAVQWRHMLSAALLQELLPDQWGPIAR